MIEFKKVSFTYPGHEQNHDRVLFNLDFRLEKGKFYSIIGSNGSGKSTMVKLINGLLYPYEGEIFVDGSFVKEKNLNSIRQKVGYIFQNPENQLVTTMVKNEIAFALENLGVPYEDMKKKVEEILCMVELEKYADTPPHMLSGGQKQRLAIASVVVMEPDYIIFDEPTSMLDMNGREEVNDLIKKLHSQGRTIILISHDIDEIVRSDEVLVMHEGNIIERKTPFEVFSDKELLEKIAFKDIPEYINIGLNLGLKDLSKDNILNHFTKKIKNSI